MRARDEGKVAAAAVLAVLAVLLLARLLGVGDGEPSPADCRRVLESSRLAEEAEEACRGDSG